jgi:hypothetical protein
MFFDKQALDLPPGLFFNYQHSPYMEMTAASLTKHLKTSKLSEGPGKHGDRPKKLNLKFAELAKGLDNGIAVFSRSTICVSKKNLTRTITLLN